MFILSHTYLSFLLRGLRNKFIYRGDYFRLSLSSLCFYTVCFRCVRLELNVNKWFTNNRRVIFAVVYFSYCAVIAARYRHRCLVTLHFAHVVELLDRIADFDVPMHQN